MSALGIGQRLARNVWIPRLPKRFDFWLLLSSAILLLIGLALIYSEGYGKEGTVFFRKQLMFVGMGIVPLAIFLFVPPRAWMRSAKVLYVINVVTLLAVLLRGHSSHHAQRWIEFGPVQFQPSEMAKLFTVLTLASFFTLRQDSIRSFSTFALSLVHVLVPLALVYKQPSLGASLVLLVIWLSIAIAANVPLRFVFGSAASLVLVLALAFRFGLVNEYQGERLKGLFEANGQTNGYQALRSEIAFGSGGVIGEGYLKGEQKQGGFIPEQQTDFIFTVLGEEGGLVGCALALLAFGFFFYRVWLVMFAATEIYYRMLAAGVLGMLAFHTFVNLGMIMKLLPVVGQWLPFMSYGGTALWLCMASVGLLLNIRSRERPVIF